MKNFFLKNKLVLIILLIALVGGAYWYFKYKNKPVVQNKYVLSTVEKGTIISSVSGSGQVSASDQLDIKSKASGDVLKVLVVNGQTVKTGDLLVQIDSKDAYTNVREAQTSLESAKLSLQKLKDPAEEIDITKAENSLQQAKDNLEKLKNSQISDTQDALDDKNNSEVSLANYHDSGFGEVADSFLDLPVVLDDLKDMFYTNTIDSSKQNIDWYANQSPFGSADSYIQDFNSAYKNARASYDKAFDYYKGESRHSDPAVIEDLIVKTYDTAKIVADAVNTADKFLRFTRNSIVDSDLSIPSVLTTHQSDLQSYTSKIQAHVSSLSTANKNIENTKKSLANNERTIANLKIDQPLELAAAEQSIREKELALADLKAGTDPLDIRSQEISVQQRQQTLSDALSKLANYTIKAPFDGLIASVDVKKGDSLSSGGSVLTLITEQQIAEVSLNEVDAAKVKIGQKATLTFDAVEGLSAAGEVIDIDSIGAVSQGVVSYTVKISFDADNDQIKPGMSVSAAIVTDIRQDVLSIPSSAIKSSGNYSYVEVPNGTVDSETANQSNGVVLPNGTTQKIVETGLSDDTQTEVVSGLSEGDMIISRTISSSATAATSNNSRSLLQSTGGVGGRMPSGIGR